MSDNTPIPNGGQGSPEDTPSSDLVEQFLDIQNKEIQVKAQELDIKKAELAHNQEIAKESIAAQLEDSRIKADYFSKEGRRKAILIGICVVGGLGFLLYSMHTGKTDFAERVLDILVGAAGGFFIGRFTKNNLSNNE